MKTVVLGSGGWGTALSLVLHRNGHPVTLWSHVPEKAAYMERAERTPGWRESLCRRSCA